MCLSKDRQLNQYWKKVALTACFYVRAARMDYHAPPCPCQLPNLLFKKKNVVFKVTVPHSLSILSVRGKAHYSTDHKVLKYTGGLSKGNFPCYLVPKVSSDWGENAGSLHNLNKQVAKSSSDCFLLWDRKGH